MEWKREKIYCGWVHQVDSYCQHVANIKTDNVPYKVADLYPDVYYNVPVSNLFISNMSLLCISGCLNRHFLPIFFKLIDGLVCYFATVCFTPSLNF